MRLMYQICNLDAPSLEYTGYHEAHGLDMRPRCFLHWSTQENTGVDSNIQEYMRLMGQIYDLDASYTGVDRRTQG